MYLGKPGTENMTGHKKLQLGTSLVGQRLGLHTPSAAGLGSFSGQGTRSHMLPLTACMPAQPSRRFLKIRKIQRSCKWRRVWQAEIRSQKHQVRQFGLYSERNGKSLKYLLVGGEGMHSHICILETSDGWWFESAEWQWWWREAAEFEPFRRWNSYVGGKKIRWMTEEMSRWSCRLLEWARGWRKVFFPELELTERAGFVGRWWFGFNLLNSSSVQFSHSVVFYSLRPHELQHTRPLCPSPTPGVHPNPCPSSRWCHPTISSSVIPFSFCPQSFPASGSFQMSQLFASGGQSIWVSASTSVLQLNTQDWSPLGWTGWISLQSKGF